MLKTRYPALSLFLALAAPLAAAAASTAPAAAPAKAAESGGALVIDRDASRHAAAAESLGREGLRPVSLDAYGDPARPDFASAWAREEGPAWRLAHGFAAAALEDSLAAWARRGWRPYMITGTGPDPLLAAALERDTVERWTRAGLERDQVRRLCDSAQKAGLRPVWLDAYGTSDRPLFAGVWRRNVEGIPWNYSMGDDESSLAQKAATFAEVWVRPALVVPVPGGTLLTVWQESSVGRWSLHPSLEGGTGLASLGAEAAKGLHPVLISGPPERERAALAGTPLGAPRGRGFTVLAAERALPAPKDWTVTGHAAPGLGAFDDYMRRLMQRHQVRAGALAMVKDGRLVLARGYTWAEAGYPVTQPNSLFRVASCSKPLTSMAVHKMLREGGQAEGPLSLKEKVIALLSLPAGGAPRDARFADITLDDLLSHSAGWIRSKENPDPVFNDYPPGHAIRRRLPSSPDGFLDYMLGQPLQFAPGSQSSYANFGYFLLGRILGNLPHGRGRSYEQAMGELVFRPLGLTRPRIGGSFVGERQPDEVMYHSRYPYLQRGHHEGGPAWVPGGYGDFDIQNMEAAGAWLLAATDYAKVLASFDREDNPVMGAEAIRTMWAPHRDPRFLRGWFATRVRRQGGDTLTAKWHNGLFPGTSTLVFYRPDKWSFALFLNRDIAPQLTGDVHGRELGRLADRVEAWPSGDLFPAVGIESFAAVREADSSAARDGAGRSVIRGGPVPLAPKL